MPPRTTKRYGTPCSPAWDDAWIATVEETENRRGKAICGARTLAGTPCVLAANHKNGRCKFHGGFNCTGAQPGNRNAVLHGLYSRAIQRCGRHCPQWEHCPLASEEVDKLPKQNRPQCPYEVAQFQMAETDLEAQSGAMTGFGRHQLLQAALAQVMMLRAGTALAIQGATETSEVRSDKYAMTTSRPSAALTAYLKLSTEYRRCVELLPEPERTRKTKTFDDEAHAAARLRNDSEVSPEARRQLHPNTHAPGRETSRKDVEAAAEKVHEIRTARKKAAAQAAETNANGPGTAQAAETNLNGPAAAQAQAGTPPPDPSALRRQKRTAQTIARLESHAREHYARAFTLYPAWREALSTDPTHDPAYFPKEIPLAAVG